MSGTGARVWQSLRRGTWRQRFPHQPKAVEEATAKQRSTFSVNVKADVNSGEANPRPRSVVLQAAKVDAGTQTEERDRSARRETRFSECAEDEPIESSALEEMRKRFHSLIANADDYEIGQLKVQALQEELKNAIKQRDDARTGWEEADAQLFNASATLIRVTRELEDKVRELHKKDEHLERVEALNLSLQRWIESQSGGGPRVQAFNEALHHCLQGVKLEEQPVLQRVDVAGGRPVQRRTSFLGACSKRHFPMEPPAV